ncbi:hypothetical protein GCM10023107_90350 [Actinoplanes octamycinicus]|nr:hypothetical protein Aoc01nite_65760 [Actinoplanes octamycinicus]
MKKSVAVAAAAGTLLLGGCAPDRPAPVAQVRAWAPPGNGITRLPAREVLKRSSGALHAAASYSMAGSMSEDGMTIRFDMTVVDANRTGTIRVGDGTIELLAAGGNQYVRADQAFWAAFLGPKGAKQMAAVMRGRWTKATKDNPQLSKWFDAIDRDIDRVLSQGLGAENGTVIKFGDGEALLVTNRFEGASVYVATTGEPYPLKIGDASGSSITFAKFGEAFPEIKEPAPADVVAVPEKTRKA